MKKINILVLLVLGLPGFAMASRQFSSFSRLANEGNIKVYARDLGGILGSGTYHTGRGLGFAGFDVGIHGAMQFKPSKANDILRSAGVTNFGMPWFQAEIGLPLKFDGFIRGFSFEGLTISGGGLRYALFTATKKPGKPQFLLVADGEAFCHTAFSGAHFGGNLVVSMTTKYFRPYFGVGVDRTRLTVKQSSGEPSLVGRTFYAYGNRMALGVNIRPFPFSYITVAYVHRHGSTGIQFGVGGRF